MQWLAHISWTLRLFVPRLEFAVLYNRISRWIIRVNEAGHEFAHRLDDDRCVFVEWKCLERRSKI